MWSRFRRHIAQRRQCADRQEARLMRALYAFERDLRQHRKRAARQYNCKLLLLPGSAVPAVVLVLQ
jgi:type II secretory pathway component PulJ